MEVMVKVEVFERKEGEWIGEVCGEIGEGGGRRNRTVFFSPVAGVVDSSASYFPIISAAPLDSMASYSRKTDWIAS